MYVAVGDVFIRELCTELKQRLQNSNPGGSIVQRPTCMASGLC